MKQSKFIKMKKTDVCKLKGTTICYLAFMENPNIVKIGKTRDFESRRRQLNTANPLILSYYTIPYDIENTLHQIFIKKKATGEWYKYENKEMFLEKVKKIILDLTNMTSCEVIDKYYYDE